jgi:hypothetical protein
MGLAANDVTSGHDLKTWQVRRNEESKLMMQQRRLLLRTATYLTWLYLPFFSWLSSRITYVWSKQKVRPSL